MLTFKKYHGEKAIKLAIKILLMNQCRVVEEPDEEEEKTILAISIVNFLKFVSKDSTYLANELIKYKDVLKAVLYAE